MDIWLRTLLVKPTPRKPALSLPAGGIYCGAGPLEPGSVTFLSPVLMVVPTVLSVARGQELPGGPPFPALCPAHPPQGPISCCFS